MGVPEALSSQELMGLFEHRGMCIDDYRLCKIQHINYYKLKAFAKPLSTTRTIDGRVEISYNGVKFSEVLGRYYQDKNLRMHLLHAIEKIEVSVKTNMAHILGIKYGAFGYLDFSRWSNKKRWTKFQIEKKQYRIKDELLKAKKKFKSTEYSNNNLDKDGFPTIWLAIDLLTFGGMVEMVEIMSEKHLFQLAKVYNCTKQELVSWLRCIQFIRNICAHNSNLIDVKLTTKPKIRKRWESRLFFVKTGNMCKPTDRLAIVILIVMELVQVINDRYQWREIQHSIKSICKDDTRANLMGFKTKNDALGLRKFIMEKDVLNNIE